MSNLRNKASEVYAEGVAQRGNFTPSGVPLRMWKYWAANTKPKRVPERENFCHFWRVVAIWAPLAWLRNRGANALESTVFWAVGAVVILGGLITACILSSNILQTVAIILAGMVAFALIITGALSGASLALPEDVRENEELPSLKFARFGALIFPASIPVFLVIKFVRNKWVKDHTFELFMTLIGSLILGIITMATLTLTYWFPAIVVAAVLVGVFGIRPLISVVADWIAGKRAIAQQREEAYYRGELTYEEYYGHPKQTKNKTEPSKFVQKLKVFFRAVGDFLILAGQVIRVNKWKICPTVEVK